MTFIILFKKKTQEKDKKKEKKSVQIESKFSTTTTICLELKKHRRVLSQPIYIPPKTSCISSEIQSHTKPLPNSN
jgi:hypothetical protein